MGKRQDGKPLVQLALAEYLRWCREKTQPTGELSKWSTPLFHFMRYAKAHRDLRKEKEEAAFRKVDEAIRSWKRLEEGQCHWLHWFGCSLACAESEFRDTWNMLYSIPGEEPLDQAWNADQRWPIELLKRAVDPQSMSDGFTRFIALAYNLQGLRDKQNIYLPVAKTAQVMGLESTCIVRYRRWAKAKGLLIEVKPAVRGAGGRGQATEYQFDRKKLARLVSATLRAEKKRERDALSEAIAELTNTDPKVGGAYIRKVAAALRRADPPFTAAEVRELPAALAAAGLNVTLTLGVVEKHIGVTRNKTLMRGAGRSNHPRRTTKSAHRIEALPGKYAAFE